MCTLFGRTLRVSGEEIENKEIVITRPDKGAGVVLLDHAEYIAKMMEILDDDTKFECLGSCEEYDNTGQNERALQAFLLRQLKAGKISEQIYKRIWPTVSSVCLSLLTLSSLSSSSFSSPAHTLYSPLSASLSCRYSLLSLSFLSSLMSPQSPFSLLSPL